MKRREPFIELDRVENLIILTFSIVLNLIWLIPIMMQLDNEYTILLLLSLFTTISIVLANYLVKIQKEKIKQRINRATIIHTKDFFDYIESDKQFCNDVLQKEVKLYSFEREEIGIGSVYTQISRKRDEFLSDI
jgi:hypothetical protein